MSLLRLLAAGKSLVGVKESAGRYRVSSHRALPTFSPKSNPFRATARPELPQTAGDAKGEPAAEVVSSAPELSGEARGVLEPESQPTERDEIMSKTVVRPAATALSRPEHTPATPRLSVAGKARSLGWVRVLSLAQVPLRRAVAWTCALPLRFKRGEPVRPVKRVQVQPPRSPKPMVQAELSLESVKVVRNDLSDSDLEIVAVRPTEAPAKREPGVARPAQNNWGRMTGRLFGAGKGVN